MTELITKEMFQQFFSDKAKLWQKYISYDFMDNIKLSDAQIRVIDQDEDQMLINGVPGSGKSVLLLYKFFKVLNLSEEPKRIVYVTFNQTLVNDVNKRIGRYNQYSKYTKENKIEIVSFHQLAKRVLRDIGFYKIKGINTNINVIEKVNDNAINKVARAALEFTDESYEGYFSVPEKERLYKTHVNSFLRDEILWIKANGLTTLEKYMSVERVGRGHNPRVTKEQRKSIFKIYEKYEAEKESGRYGNYLEKLDMEDYALLLLTNKELIHDEHKINYIFIDEIQDFQPMQLMALKLLCKEQLVAAGDTKQRIYKKNLYSFSELGFDFSGKRSKVLNENFRSTKEIMKLAGSLQFLDEGKNSNVKYVNEGELPTIRAFKSKVTMYETLKSMINEIHTLNPKETIAIVNRVANKTFGSINDEAKAMLKSMFSIIDIDNFQGKFNETKTRQIFYSDMKSIKGLEFDHVIILNFSNSFIPDPDEIKNLEKVANDKNDSYQRDLENLYNDEKKLVYVAMTRARKTLTFMVPLKKGTIRLDCPSFILDDFDEMDYNIVNS